MRIGIDFDGVISDCTVVKQMLAKQWYNANLRPEECTTEIAKNIIGKEQYEKIYKTIESGDLALSCTTAPNCTAILAKLIADGHRIVIVTTLDVPKRGFALEFMRKNKIPYHHWVSLPWRKNEEGILARVKKKFVMAELHLDVLIDDSYENLTPMIGGGVLLLLFDTPANQRIKEPEGIIRAKGWAEVYKWIQFSSTNAPQTKRRRS